MMKFRFQIERCGRDGLREDGTPIPPPSSRAEYAEVAA
jgi:hypothetical protein